MAAHMRRLGMHSWSLPFALISTDTPTRCVGLRHPPLPKGLRELHTARARPYEYIHARPEIHRQDSGLMVSLERRECRGKDWSEQLVTYEVRAVLVPPPAGPGQYLLGGTCAVGVNPFEKGGARLEAVATFLGDSLFATKVDRVWRANFKAERFEPTPAVGVNCVREMESGD
jgi:hypothetical protein